MTFSVGKDGPSLVPQEVEMYNKFDMAENLPMVRSVPISLHAENQKRYRTRNIEKMREYDRNRKRAAHFTAQGHPKTYRGPHAEIAMRVDTTEVSEPPVWRKGPVPAINPGWPCWVLTFEAWPKCVIFEGLVEHVDLTAKLYIVNIKARKWAVSSERVFTQESAARQEAEIYETINQALYLTPADGAYDDEDEPLPKLAILQELESNAKSVVGETTNECEQSNFGW